MGCLLKPIIGIIKTILMIIGLITLIVAIVIGVAFWQLTKTPALEGEMHPVHATAADAAQFDQKVDDLKMELLDPTIPPGTPVILQLTEEMVTGKIMESIEDVDIPLDVSDVWVNFVVDEETGANKVQILGKVNVGLSLTAGIVMEIEIDSSSGEPKVILDEVAIGSGFGIPQAAKDQIANLIPTEKALTDMIKDFPVSWDSVSTEGGMLTFTGSKKAATGPVI